MGDGARWCLSCARAGRSGGKNMRSRSEAADCGMSGSGSAMSGLWQSGEAIIPLSDESAAASMMRRCATLVRFVLLFADRRGLRRAFGEE